MCLDAEQMRLVSFINNLSTYDVPTCYCIITIADTFCFVFHNHKYYPKNNHVFTILCIKKGYQIRDTLYCNELDLQKLMKRFRMLLAPLEIQKS